jgi:hypothetical protein
VGIQDLELSGTTPQQADVDDGCYLPMSFVSQTKRPSRATTVFFAAAEEALKPLVEEKRWKLVTDKPTCIRIVIAAYAHIDIPLYAIPDEEFVTLAKASMERYGYDSLTEAVNMAERDAWTALPADKVLLAHRECNWMPSDPRPVKEWFLGEVEAKGEQFRRVVRYLKAFRDWRWSSGGPASILLMAAAAPLFEKRDRRDDLALLDVVAALPARLRAGVNNPVDESESLTDALAKRASKRLRKRSKHLKRCCAEPPTPAALHRPASGCKANSVRVFRTSRIGSRWYPLPPPLPQRRPRLVRANLVGRTKAG